MMRRRGRRCGRIGRSLKNYWTHQFCNITIPRSIRTVARSGKLMSMDTWGQSAAVLAAAAALCLAGCQSRAGKPEAERVVRVAPVSAASEQSVEVYPGEVRARYESALGFRVAGMAIMSMGSSIPPTLVNKVHQPYSEALNSLVISSPSHFAEPNQLVKYSEKVK